VQASGLEDRIDVLLANLDETLKTLEATQASTAANASLPVDSTPAR
jgi:hypothetical protein